MNVSHICNILKSCNNDDIKHVTLKELLKNVAIKWDDMISILLLYHHDVDKLRAMHIIIDTNLTCNVDYYLFDILSLFNDHHNQVIKLLIPFINNVDHHTILSLINLGKWCKGVLILCLLDKIVDINESLILCLFFKINNFEKQKEFLGKVMIKFNKFSSHFMIRLLQTNVYYCDTNLQNDQIVQMLYKKVKIDQFSIVSVINTVTSIKCKMLMLDMLIPQLSELNMIFVMNIVFGSNDEFKIKMFEFMLSKIVICYDDMLKYLNILNDDVSKITVLRSYLLINNIEDSQWNDILNVIKNDPNKDLIIDMFMCVSMCDNVSELSDNSPSPPLKGRNNVSSL